MANQNSLGLSGPFASVLSKPYEIGPTYQSTAPPTVSGYGGKTEGIAMLADNFLKGVSQGRWQSFERSENQRQQAMNSLGVAIQDVQNAQIPDALKQQQMANLQKLQLQMIIGDHSIEGEGSKGKKGKNKDQDENPVLGLVRHFATNMLGPGAEKQPVSTEDLQAAIGNVYGFLNDPKNSIQSQVKNADNSIMSIYGQMQANNGGRPVTWNELVQNPAFQKAANQAMYITNGAPTPGLKMIMQSAQDAQAQQDPLYRARVDEEMARAEADRARGQRLYTDRNGNTVRYDATTGSYFDTANQPIAPNDPRLQGLSLIGQQTRAIPKQVFRSGNGETVTFDPSTGHYYDAGGNQIPEGDPRLRNLYRPGTQPKSTAGRGGSTRPDHWLDNKLSSINKTYDAEVFRVDMSNKPQAQKDKEIEQIEKRRQNALSAVTKQPPPIKGSSTSTDNSKDEAIYDWFVQHMFGPSSTGGKQANAPSAGANAAASL